MSFPRYENYKDSGVEWLGEVPGHWMVVPFYSVAKEREEPNKGMVEDNLLSLSYGRIVQKDISLNDGLLPESFETYQIIRQGDIVFRLTDLQNDKRSLRTAIVEETGIITSAYLAAMPISIAPRYLNHLLRAYDMLKVFYSMGGGLRQSMKFSDVKRLPTLFPPHEEQKIIAAFLDRETTKIDSLIAEQQRLIELLKEKRQAVISHAITKGLNPDAPMKDSGVEWLGLVPAHWDVSPIKFVISKIESGTSVNATDEPARVNEIGVLKTSCVYSGIFDPSENKTVIEQEIDRVSCPVKPDTLIVSRMNTPELVGATGLVTDAPENIYLPDRLWQISFSDACPAFVYYWTQTPVYRAYIKSVCSGTSSSMQNLSQDQFRSFILALPTFEEQKLIADFLQDVTTTLDTLTAEAQRGIDLLKERRAALISAAVTGKIDVRHCQPHSD